MPYSEQAQELGDRIAERVWYPRVADAVAKAIQNCADERCPLSEEQQAQIFRAMFEAGDGVFNQITLTIADEVDQISARRLIDSVGFPFDPEVGR